METIDKIRLLLKGAPGRIKLENIYRYHLGRRDGLDLWVVDGAKADLDLYPYFIYGGNDQRYRYNPYGEVWLDCRMGVIELNYTILHEVEERRLMRERGWSYGRAHNEGLAKEEQVRLADTLQAARKEAQVMPRWCALWRKSALQMGSVKQHQIYRQRYGKVKGLDVWFVDGCEVRRLLDGDFLYAGHDLKCKYIPPREVWVDMHLAVGEFKFSLLGEVTERNLYASGTSWRESCELALTAVADERIKQEKLAREHEAQLPPVRHGCRERGSRKSD